MHLHSSHNARLAGVVTALLLGLTARPVSAQAVPEVTQHTEDVVAEIPAEVEDETTWNIAAGANISTGNTRARNFNAGTDFYVLRDIHALSFRTAFVFGQADVDGGGPGNYEINSRNLNSRLRYDIFLTANDALFIAVAHRWDSFAGLQTRVQFQAGYLRNLIKNESTRVWLEAGYDFTFDNRQNSANQRVICSEADVANPLLPECTRVVRNFQDIHALRLFYGATHAFNENVTGATGVEFLVNLNELEGGEADRFEDIRLNWEASLNARLVENLAIEVKFRLLYDRVPAASEELDTNTLISLIYTLL